MALELSKGESLRLKAMEMALKFMLDWTEKENEGELNKTLTELAEEIYEFIVKEDAHWRRQT